MYTLSSHKTSSSALRIALMALAALFLATPPAMAQTTGKITIGGKVYGGGKQGAILTGNTTSNNTTPIESVEITNKYFRASEAAQASQVTIHDGTIVGVFGGGEQGRAYGKTNVTVTNGAIGIGTVDPDSIATLSEATRLVNGNVFGAGDGDAAAVFGGSNVTIIGGRVNGSVYGGGNEADLVGCSELDLQGGIYVGAVFGGARKSNIYGYTFVNIDGAHAKNDLHIIDVYGGNDIAGEIHPDERWSWTKQSFLQVPFNLADNTSTQHLTTTPASHVNNTWNAFILATEDVSANKYKTLVDNLYGGGNGDYDYSDPKYTGLSKPVIDRTYMQLEGGVYGSVYGGGNAATVAKSTDICLLNNTTINTDYLASIAGTESAARYTADYQFNRVFGGNNKEPMAIRPNWYLERGTVNNLYSGGNAGAMTYYNDADKANPKGGIALAIESNDMTINNVYGGCRMADVVPGGTYDGTKAISAETFLGTTFQKGYAARVLIKGGNINNVYGGNDVSGNVYYGAQVEILSSINGDVYGAGNGSYAYTDNPALENHPLYGDYYYNGGAGGLASAEALNLHRPNVEKSYVHLAGNADPDEWKFVYIGGNVYCGGNSATLRSMSGSLADAKAELHIGSNVIADGVFLGSNGANMVASTNTTDVLQIIKNGPADYDKATLGAYSSLDLTASEQFEEYMRGVEVGILPSVTFDANYVDHSTKFGSMFCGGNVGSMSAPGLFTADYLNNIVIYNKLVGGSNNANVAKTDYNAFHLGGIIGAPNDNGYKVQLNVAGLQLEPHVLTRNPFSLHEFSFTDDAVTLMLKGGNIYGGCYASGYINGGVTINITENAISDGCAGANVPYSVIQNDVLASTLSVYGGGYGKETEIWGDTHINITGNGQIMKAYGGGEMGVVGKLMRDADGLVQGLDANNNYTAASIYDDPATDDAKEGTYNTYVTLNANVLANDELNAAKIYGGGFQGLVSGSTTLALNAGSVYDAFGGASNADILGVAQTYVGKGAAPHVYHNVYGANDFGGQIYGTKLFTVDNTPNEMEKIVAQAYVEYAAGRIDGDLFGGPCGAYHYTTDSHYAAAIAAPGFTKPQLLTNLLTPEMLVQHSGAGYAANSFVNVTSTSSLTTDFIAGRLEDPVPSIDPEAPEVPETPIAERSHIGGIFGAGEGLKGMTGLADEAGSYVRLASATVQQRGSQLAPNVYGAGYCSTTKRSLVDAFSGNYGTLFGGCYGVKYQERCNFIELLKNDPDFELAQLNSYISDSNNAFAHNLSYMGDRSAVRLYTMVNPNMDIYGAGANSGSKESGVVLHGGQAHNVYGASFNEGITYAATIETPKTSTSMVNAIFGGAKGASDEFPCDVYYTFISYQAPNARIADAIYGGNHNCRMTRNSYVDIHVPVKSNEGRLGEVFGGGLGDKTVTLYTEVNIYKDGQVANVYGGGKDGQILDTPSFRHYLEFTLCDVGHGGKTYLHDIEQLMPDSRTPGYIRYLWDYEVDQFNAWIDSNQPTVAKYDVNDRTIGSYTPNNHGRTIDIYRLSTQQPNLKNTNVFIEEGGLVTGNAYGGGLGELAQVSGATNIELHGGIVQGDIYGGGNAGPVKEYAAVVHPENSTELTQSSTHVFLGGGSARNVYGGGLGDTADVTGSTNVVLGTKDMGEGHFTDNTHNPDLYGVPYAGDPVVERSLYGGGQNGAVFGTANVTIYQGHVGYIVERDAEGKVVVDTDGKATYVENLDLNNAGDNLLDQNGNAFGAGYGEGASVDNTFVNIYGGTIRNSLYGGGEIAAVGQGTMAVESGANRVLGNISVPGRTHVYIYNGLVQGDVFGGGRGYSYDLTGNEVIGKTLYTDGYVFGTTDVNIRGGVIGTPTTLAMGHGNVFGGGNIGYCYSDAVKSGTKGDGSGEGRYYADRYVCNECHTTHLSKVAPVTCPECKRSTTDTDENYRTTFTKQAEHVLSEDTRVVISPYAQVTAEGGVTIDGTSYAKGDYVPTEALNLLADNDTRWASISIDGVDILNAVFAGGNVSAGSDKVYANAITVFGNATASINDVYNRDLVTIGTDNIGGLYGDGNLTFVDGYRELNITNYGTDYYRQAKEIDVEAFNALTERERAYYKLQYTTSSAHSYNYYVCTEDGEYHGVVYKKGQHIDATTYNAFTADEKAFWKHGLQEYTTSSSIASDTYDMMTEAEKAKWAIHGLCTTFSGRVLNTIQRADFCGVFGSRMVLQGAQDRVPEVVDYTHYTLNRVGEVSLNKRGDHGNYFGLYNVVNYLGALTSDVAFDAPRTTDNSDPSYAANGTTTYYRWKEENEGNKKRNNGTSHNMVALASGVYLELVNEIGSTPEEKNYGPITGVVQLDLINVMPGLGGGYVYAKNIHGTRQETSETGIHENLSVYNQGAVNNTLYTYNESSRKRIQTSGNFIHNTKQIVDDCFPAGGRYDDYNQAPAHYWYIRGEYYVYDQYVSAYTGSSNAYLENIDIPLTITAGAHGKLDLLDIKPNYYAYYFDEAQTTKLGEAGGNLIVLNGNTYGLNDVITYWDYMQLTPAQQKHFVEETYMAKKAYCTTDGGAVVEPGEVITKAQYDAIKSTTVYDPDDFTTDAYGTQHMKAITLADVYHISNAISHENGYVLTVDMTNPVVWDKWYSPTTGANKLNGIEYKDAGNQSQYKAGPTYYTTTPGVYGQHYYQLDDIVTKYVKDHYDAIPEDGKIALQDKTDRPQAQVTQAYVAITATEYDLTNGSGVTSHKTVQEGVAINAAEYAQLDATTKAKFAKAYTCTRTYEEDKDNNLYVYFSELIPESRYQELYAKLVAKYVAEGKTQTDAEAAATQDMSDHFDNAYMVTQAGWYGGQHFTADENYRALDTWASLSDEDRKYFQFRYDALDALVLSSYPGTGNPGGMIDYDGSYWNPEEGWPEHRVYGARQPIDYEATYSGSAALTYKDAAGTDKTIAKGQVLNREQFEQLPNEQHHYTIVKITAEQVSNANNTTNPVPVHIAKEGFTYGGVAYSAGRVIDDAIYNSYEAADKARLFTDFTPTTPGSYYFCRSDYDVNEFGEGKPVKDLVTSTTYDAGTTVPVGAIINATTYEGLTNRQKDFIVHGNAPIETSTFYVASDSNIDDLSKDRVITVIYQYKYEESDESGQNIEEVTEKHILNIHLVFKTGVPTVGQLQPPSIILPGETVGLKTPAVSEGAYTILGGGWELYTNAADAEKHQNGANYTNNATPMYWYQDGYYVAYYAKTYLGKTYSNAVQFKVANYHDIADVMADTKNYMFVDHPGVHRDSKIYINNSTTEADPDAPKSEIDMLYDLFQVSLATSKKTIQVDEQVTNSSGQPLYYIDEAAAAAKDQSKTKTEVTPFPVTHTVDKVVPVFDEHARNCENLEFHITSDVATKKATWDPIGWIPTGSETDAETCFRGNVHGHGMTVSGINKSLFVNLCGSVYNLGVTGSFTKSGIADRVSLYKDWDPAEPQGMAQNCWIHTTGTPDHDVLPVIGVPNDLTGTFTDARGMHTFNCYFPKEDGYDISGYGPYITATERPMLDFHNGSVAFDLNGFYLHKRYADQRVAKYEAESTLGQGGSIYNYWIEYADGTLKETPNEGYYNQGALHKYGTDYYGYVENIYADGDFVYAMGEIPTTTNGRFYSPLSRYLPIWPDDYIFFGQMLTYGYDETNRPYQSLPAAATKTVNIDHRLITDNKTNVVFRAPAYYRSSKKSVVHFNPGAVFADHVNGHPDWPVHPGLTAIDFTGLNDVIRQNGGSFDDIPVTQSYYNGPRDGINFPPALNFTTLLSFETHDITQNLLAYAPDPTLHEGTKRTNDILTDYFNEPDFADYYNMDGTSTDGYRRVASLDASAISGIHGHVVQKNGSYVAHTDHYLVDRQDFNSPIRYSFASDKRMWYQRAPKTDKNPDGTLLYAGVDADGNSVGWEGVSLPFSAELVSTQQKGEITHFYNTAIDATYAPGYTSGHEYWLREFTGTTSATNGVGEVLVTARMNYPIAVAGPGKTVTNHFLWDYYYNADGKDDNNDGYGHDQNNENGDNNTVMGRRYYSEDRIYDNYPLSEPGRPYIMGFPGSRYYEFDLSGTFMPEHSGAVTPQKLEPQTISFVSAPGAVIGISDDEMEAQYADNTHDGYMFAPSYLNVEAPKSGAFTNVAEFNEFFGTDYNEAEFNALPAEQKTNYYYTLNATGSAFEKTTAATNVCAFRPYFLAVGSSQLKAPASRSITFGMGNDFQFEPDDDTIEAAATHGLNIYAKKGKIVVESTLEAPKRVRIATLAGQVITTFTIDPGERVATPVPSGVYVTNLRKLIVE